MKQNAITIAAHEDIAVIGTSVDESLPGDSDSLFYMLVASQPMHWRAGAGAQTAVLTDPLIMPGAPVFVEVNTADDTIAAILASEGGLQPNAINTIADVTVSSTPIAILPLDLTRRRAVIKQISANTVRIGDASVGAADGLSLGVDEEVVITTTAAVLGIREGGSDGTVTAIVETAGAGILSVSAISARPII